MFCVPKYVRCFSLPSELRSFCACPTILGVQKTEHPKRPKTSKRSFSQKIFPRNNKTNSEHETLYICTYIYIHYIYVYVLVILTPKSSCDFVSLPSNDSKKRSIRSWILAQKSFPKKRLVRPRVVVVVSPQWKVKICAVLYTPCGITRKGVKDVKGEDEWSGDIQVDTIFWLLYFFSTIKFGIICVWSFDFEKCCRYNDVDWLFGGLTCPYIIIYPLLLAARLIVDEQWNRWNGEKRRKVVKFSQKCRGSLSMFMAPLTTRIKLPPPGLTRPIQGQWWLIKNPLMSQKTIGPVASSRSKPFQMIIYLGWGLKFEISGLKLVPSNPQIRTRYLSQHCLESSVRW